MSDWISPSNIIGTFSALFGFMALPLAIWVYFKQKTKKELSYQIISDTPIVSINADISGVIEVTLNGKPIRDARFVVIKVWNSGNKEVAKEDYDTPVSFEFVNRTIISGEVISTEPADLMQKSTKKNFLSLQYNTVIFPEYLLNQGQSIRISLLTSNGAGDVKQRGRIKGGNIVSFEPKLGSRRSFRLAAIILTVFAIIAVIFDGILLYIALSNHR